MRIYPCDKNISIKAHKCRSILYDICHPWKVENIKIATNVSSVHTIHV